MYVVILVCNLSAPYNCLEVRFPLESQITICMNTAQAEIATHLQENYPGYRVTKWGCTRGPRMAKL